VSACLMQGGITRYSRHAKTKNPNAGVKKVWTDLVKTLAREWRHFVLLTGSEKTGMLGESMEARSAFGPF